MNDATLPEQRASPAQRAFAQLRDALRTRIIGQEALVDRLLIALLADGHLLVEGAPGLAKTTAVKSLLPVSRATSIGCSSLPTCSPPI